MGGVGEAPLLRRRTSVFSRFPGKQFEWPALSIANPSASSYQILQVVSVTVFERVPILQALQQHHAGKTSGPFSNQLGLLDL